MPSNRVNWPATSSTASLKEQGAKGKLQLIWSLQLCKSGMVHSPMHSTISPVKDVLETVTFNICSFPIHECNVPVPYHCTFHLVLRLKFLLQYNRNTEASQHCACLLTKYFFLHSVPSIHYTVIYWKSCCCSASAS